MFYFLAIETKESAVVFPGLVFLGEMLDEEGSFARRMESLLKRRALFFFSFAAPLAASFAIRAAVLKGFLISKSAGFFELENPLVTLSFARRAGNAAAILLRGAGRVVFPLRLSADESAWQLPVYGFRSPVFWASLLGVGTLAAAGVALFRRRRAAGSGLLFFLLAALPTSNFLFVTGTIMAERLLYLPSAGIALFAASCFPPDGAGLLRRRRAVAALAAVTLAFLARTIVRNTVWLDDRTLFTNLVVTSPDSAKAHYDLAYEDADKKRYPSAYAEYRRATEIYANYYDAWAGRGRMAGELGDLSEAVADGRKAVQIFPTYENGWFTSAFCAERRGDFKEAESDYREGVRLCPKSYPLAYHWAVFLWRRGRADEAAAAFARAIELEPDMALNHDDLGRLFASKGWTGKGGRGVGRIGRRLRERRSRAFRTREDRRAAGRLRRGRRDSPEALRSGPRALRPPSPASGRRALAGCRAHGPSAPGPMDAAPARSLFRSCRPRGRSIASVAVISCRGCIVRLCSRRFSSRDSWPLPT